VTKLKMARRFEELRRAGGPSGPDTSPRGDLYMDAQPTPMLASPTCGGCSLSLSIGPSIDTESTIRTMNEVCARIRLNLYTEKSGVSILLIILVRDCTTS
jgi:hypothetical protein